MKAGLPDDVPFDGDRAIKELESLCDLGPRVSGSPAIKKQREIMVKYFTDAGFKVRLQEFEGKQRSQKAAVPMANIIASWEPGKKRRVMVCGHYDTRPLADQERDRRNWTKPFVSANDGTSTCAWMMELARHMKAWSPEVGVDFVLFDGEEWGLRQGSRPLLSRLGPFRVRVQEGQGQVRIRRGHTARSFRRQGGEDPRRTVLLGVGTEARRSRVCRCPARPRRSHSSGT